MCASAGTLPTISDSLSTESQRQTELDRNLSKQLFGALDRVCVLLMELVSFFFLTVNFQDGLVDTSWRQFDFVTGWLDDCLWRRQFLIWFPIFCRSFPPPWKSCKAETKLEKRGKDSLTAQPCPDGLISSVVCSRRVSQRIAAPPSE